MFGFLGFIALSLAISGFILARRYELLGMVPLGFGLAFLLWALSAPLSPIAMSFSGLLMLYGIGFTFTPTGIIMLVTEVRANRKQSLNTHPTIQH